jgi:hypothetical protein
MMRFVPQHPTVVRFVPQHTLLQTSITDISGAFRSSTHPTADLDFHQRGVMNFPGNSSGVLANWG